MTVNLPLIDTKLIVHRQQTINEAFVFINASSVFTNASFIYKNGTFIYRLQLMKNNFVS